jgi:amidase
VAAGLVPFATATDGGGSIRIPAACCGLVGLKPSAGLLPMSEHWYGLSHAGVLTRTVADTVLALQVLADLPPAAAPGRLRVAVSSKAPMPTPVGVEQAAALALLAERLTDLGHDVVAQDPPWGPSMPAAFVPRFLAGARDDLAGLAEPRAAEARTRAVARLAPPARMVRAARARGAGLTAVMEEFLTGFDVLLLPMLAEPAISADRYVGVGAVRTMLGVTRWMPWAPPQNVTGQPALSLPAGRTPAGLPLAVQLVARRGRDAELLALAGQLEQDLPWAQDRPPAFA